MIKVFAVLLLFSSPSFAIPDHYANQDNAQFDGYFNVSLHLVITDRKIT